MENGDKPTAGWLIKKYLETRNSIRLLTDRFEKEIAPYKEGLEAIESLLMEEINRLEGQAIKTEDGTAYRMPQTFFRVADRQIWFDWVFSTGHRDMLTAAVSKDAVKEFMETENAGAPPPGLNMTQIYKVNVRTADK